MAQKSARLNVGAVVMAGGTPRHFSANKLLAELGDGKTVIEHTLDALPREALDLVVVTRSREVANLMVGLDVPYFVSILPLMSDTVRIGLAMGEDQWDGCLFVPGDQPLLLRRSVDALLAAFQRQPDRVVRLAWHGVPAWPIVFPRKAFRLLDQLEGDVDATQVLRDNPSLARKTVLVEAASEREVMGIGTPADLERIERLTKEDLL